MRDFTTKAARRIGVTALSIGLLASSVAFAPSDVAPDAHVVQNVPGPGLFISENIEYVGTIPLDSPGVGGKVRVVNDVPHYFITGEKGLAIYDVSSPALPILVSLTPFPHSQNEDLSVSLDGTRVVISADGGLPAPVLINQGVHVFDTSDITAPVKIASLGDGPHTTMCADPACEWLYTSDGDIIDATNAESGTITRVSKWNYDRDGQVVGGRHALNVDAAGYVISDSTPRLVLDPRPHIGADGTEYGYARPEVIAQGNRRNEVDSRLQHNNIRPSADLFVPRDSDNPADVFEEPDTSAGTTITLPEGSLRTGEILVANSESNINPTCNMSGALSTWDMRDFDKGRAPVQLDVFHPASGTYADGDAALAVSGCSGHWFDVRDEFVAAAWYDHGVHVFEVGLDTGKLTEVGFFQPVATIAGQAQWIDDEYIYSADYARGIDILKFNKDAPRPSDNERLDSWYAGAAKGQSIVTQQDAYYCKLATQN